MRRRRIWIALFSVTALAVAGCGGDSSDVGEAAPAAEAQRTVDVTITQTKRYDPPSITVAPGEVVTFRVTNAAGELHEFMLGDDDAHAEHEEMMGGMPMGSMKMADQPHFVDLDPGETKQLTWKFPDKVGTTVIYGSHVPGDFDGGLRGTITVGG